MHRERQLLKQWGVLDELRKGSDLLFVRANGMEVVGVLTKVGHQRDSGWGVDRKVALGFTFDGGKIEEFLDRKNDRTGELENLIQIQTEMMLVTARNSNTHDDTKDKDFQYILNPHQMNEIKDGLDQVTEYKRIAKNLEKKTSEAIRQRESYARQLETAQSDAESLRERVSLYADKLGQALTRAEWYRTQNKWEQSKILEMDGFLSERLKGASHLGKLKGMDSADVVLSRAEKEFEIKQKFTKLGLDEKAVTQDDFNRLEQHISGKVDQFPSVASKAEPKPKLIPPVEE